MTEAKYRELREAMADVDRAMKRMQRAVADVAGDGMVAPPAPVAEPSAAVEHRVTVTTTDAAIDEHRDLRSALQARGFEVRDQDDRHDWTALKPPDSARVAAGFFRRRYGLSVRVTDHAGNTIPEAR